MFALIVNSLTSPSMHHIVCSVSTCRMSSCKSVWIKDTLGPFTLSSCVIACEYIKYQVHNVIRSMYQFFQSYITRYRAIVQAGDVVYFPLFNVFSYYIELWAHLSCQSMSVVWGRRGTAALSGYYAAAAGRRGGHPVTLLIGAKHRCHSVSTPHAGCSAHLCCLRNRSHLLQSGKCKLRSFVRSCNV